MSRKQISTNIEKDKYFLLPFIICLGFVFFRVLGDIEKMAYTAIFLFILSALFYFYHHTKTVTFDDDFMYVIGKQIRKMVPLERVYVIKPTVIHINDVPMWKIGYYDEREKAQSVLILPEYEDDRFDEFKAKVKEKNHQTEMV